MFFEKNISGAAAAISVDGGNPVCKLVYFFVETPELAAMSSLN
jgi:hypothetical protein